MKLLISLIISITTLAGCGDSSRTTQQAEFSNLIDCLAGIEEASGSRLEIITDKVNEVSGFLNINGKKEYFGCNREVTGTKGKIYRGYFTVSKN